MPNLSDVDLTVVICAHNPDAGRLSRALESLEKQSLTNCRWDVVLIDNASDPPLSDALIPGSLVGRFRIVRELKLGLSAARFRGFCESSAELMVLVDDDNVLSSNYLADVLSEFAIHPQIGLLGGVCVAEFERPPDPWATEFLPLLALRDLGASPQISAAFGEQSERRYPACAPIGAGMGIRREAAKAWMNAYRSGKCNLTDRRGSSLTSAGDNDIVLHALGSGWGVGYFPSLRVLHLIPQQRLRADYLARLNRGIQNSWMQVLLAHNVSPWPPLTRLGALLRVIRSWLREMPVRDPAAKVRFAGRRGHFEGRVL